MQPPHRRRPLLGYAARARRFRARAAQQQRHARTLANVRLVVFVTVAGLLLWLPARSPVFWLVALLGAAVFIWLVRRHRAARERLRELNARAALCDVGVSRRRRSWGSLPVTLAPTVSADHPYAHDLDLFGARSVSQLLAPVYTLHGRRTISDWLLTTADPPAIRARQQAVRALARETDFRESLTVAAQEITERGHARLDHFIRWVRSAELPAPTAATVWLARLLPVTIIALIIADATELTAGAWWPVPLAASILFNAFTLRGIYRTFDAAFSRDPAPLSYARVFERAQRLPPRGAALQRIQAQLHSGGTSAAHRLKQLEQIMLYADVRHSGTASVLLDLFFLWSFHAWLALRRWQKQARSDLPAWFAAVGELEALCALATLAHDQPRWCFPRIVEGSTRIRARGVGHPMLRDGRRVHNDVALGPPGSFLFITGSNMSGKSTLLRALGVNTVLAHAGAPVCAQRYSTPPLRLFTSINVHDSLADGVSLYLAQLRRVKLIVDAAGDASDRLCCYLLDEILSGTNSTDRTIAVRAVLHQLLASSAIGALATHDLSLTSDELIRSAGQSIHFRESIDPGTGEMSFDYRIRDGVVTTSNALSLLRMMGLRL